MAASVLESLLVEELHATAAAISGAPALRQFLAMRPVVRAVYGALVSGTLTDQNLRSFVEELLKDFRPRVLFPHDLTLASLAVALADRHTSFTEEYLRGLASLKAAEMPYAPRVAEDVLSR